MMKNIFKKVLVLLSLFVFSQTLVANEQDDLKQHFLKSIDQVLLVVKNHTLSKDERNSEIVKLLTPMFDFKLMAKLSLGKKEWSKLSKEDRVKFVDLYVERMKTSYSSKIDTYKDQIIEVKNIEQKKNKITLTTEVLDKHESMEVKYKFYKPKKQKQDKDVWIIYDVEIIGISILKADRAQFKEFLKTKTMSELMIKIAKK